MLCKLIILGLKNTSKTGYKIPIFLTNDSTWELIDQDGIERPVSGPFSQSDLKTQNFSQKR